MGGLFSSKKKPPPSRVTEHDKAVLELKKQRDQLQIYQKKVKAEQGKLQDLARQLVKSGQKEKALLLLKKKKHQQNLLEKTRGQIENVEMLANDIEFAQMEGNVIEGLKIGNEALKNINKLISLEDAERIMDETREGVEYQEQLSEILSGSIMSSEDEDAILEELEQITSLDLPSVPHDDLDEQIAEKKEKVKEKREQPAMLAS